MSKTSLVQSAQLVCTNMLSLKGIRRPVTANSPRCLQSRHCSVLCGFGTSLSSEQLTTDSELSSFLLSFSSASRISSSPAFSLGAELASLAYAPEKTSMVLAQKASNHWKNCSLMRITACNSHCTILGSSSAAELSSLPSTRKSTSFFWLASEP